METVLQVCLYFYFFALTHSILVADKTKLIVRKIIGHALMQRYYRFFFTIISVITLLIVTFKIHNLPDYEIIQLPIPIKIIFIALQGTGILLLFYAGQNFNLFEFLGLKQLIGPSYDNDSDIEGLRKIELIKTGAYRIVRHPMYLAGILIFTFNPYITQNSLTITILADSYLIFGAYIESKRYVKQYGQEYIKYSQEVPMIMPNLLTRK